jgi:hypothetical protein
MGQMHTHTHKIHRKNFGEGPLVSIPSTGYCVCAKKRERGYTPYRTEVDACLLFFFAAKNDEHNKSIKIIKG